MRRKHKTGLDYFSFDVDFFNDEKIEFVSAKYGLVGELIVVKLLCRIYRNGYFLQWGEDECLLFAKRSGGNIDVEMVKNVVDELVVREFFHGQIFKDFSVLTSNGVQRRFLEATKRRKDVEMTQNYLIADIDGYDVNIVSLNVDISAQSKVKESKVKKRSKTFCSDSVEFRLAEFLLKEIRKNNSNFKEPNLQTWSREFDSMIRIDKRDPKLIGKVIRWCQEDNVPDHGNFCWATNILSAGTLRKKYDMLVMKMNTGNGGSVNTSHSALNGAIL
jgi:hypothetical protein